MRFWNLIPDDEMPGDGVLDIEGPISEDDWWGDGCSSREFRKALEGVGNVTVHINSPGGDVMAGAEIYSALREHSLNGKGKVKVIITALAASAASVVAMAGDEILISPVAYMMIHNPWSMAVGDAQEMRKTAKVLDEIRDGLITAYQQRTGKGRDELKKMLENETWMSATRCVEEGFADDIYGGAVRASAQVNARMAAKATSEDVRKLILRWEQAHGEKPKVARAPVNLNGDTRADCGPAGHAETKAAGAETEARAPWNLNGDNRADCGPAGHTETKAGAPGRTPEEQARRDAIARRAEIMARHTW